MDWSSQRTVQQCGLMVAFVWPHPREEHWGWEGKRTNKGWRWGAFSSGSPWWAAKAWAHPTWGAECSRGREHSSLDPVFCWPRIILWDVSHFPDPQMEAPGWFLQSPPGSSVHGILQARILEWVAMPSSRGSSWPRDRTWVSCTAGCRGWPPTGGKMESMHRGVWHTVTSQGMDPNYEGLLLLELKMSFIEFPVVQWLRLHLPMQG